MKGFNYVLILCVVFNFQNSFSQSVEINGKIVSEVDVENIHVINKTAQIFTTTNSKGEFKITAKLNDTLVFSSIQHVPKQIAVSNKMITTKTCLIKLDEQINELDEVLVGKILTGDLLSDINNTEGDPPINFYDVGIPGYKGKKATQSERRLAEAGEFKPIMLLGLLGGGLPLNPILNGISGRTKELKERVRLESKANLLRKIKSNLSEGFFSIYELDENLRADFFYFCEESPNFIECCSGKSDIEIWEFLNEKLIQYKNNLKANKE